MVKEILTKGKPEWKETIISTDVDRLLKYLTEKGSANTKRISKDLGIPEQTILGWAKALTSSKLIEKEYSTKGVILKVGSKNQKITQKKIAEVHKEIGRKIKRVRSNVQGESQTITEVKKELEKLGILLEKDRKESYYLEKRIFSLKDTQIKLKKELLKDILSEREIETEISSVLNNVHKTLSNLKEAEGAFKKFVGAKKELDEDMKTLKQLRQYDTNIDLMLKTSKKVSVKEQRTNLIFRKAMSSLKKLLRK